MICIPAFLERSMSQNQLVLCAHKLTWRGVSREHEDGNSMARRVHCTFGNADPYGLFELNWPTAKFLSKRLRSRGLAFMRMTNMKSTYLSSKRTLKKSLFEY